MFCIKIVAFYSSQILQFCNVLQTLILAVFLCGPVPPFKFCFKIGKALSTSCTTFFGKILHLHTHLGN